MIKKFNYSMIRLSIYLAYYLLCLLPSVPLHVQQVVLAGGGSLSQAGVACTVSIDEVFTNVYLSLALSNPSLSFGVTHPATKNEMTAGNDDDDDSGDDDNGNGDDDNDDNDDDNGGGSGSGGDDDSASSPVEGATAIQAYYDPPTQSVRIRFGTTAHMPRTCRVYALNSALRQMTTLPDNPESAVSLSGIASGFYLLQISAGNDLLTIKIIRQ
ncbi:MAG: T9SS type A sorting domain-containing protein [Tannerella sp.]|jgi:hypothetical protein|nr:T9SS type A sorting domain-containing protein [Tannerella sp.]